MTALRSDAPPPPLAFRGIYEAHSARVLRVLSRFGVSPSDVEDATQEVFVIVHRKLPEFRWESSLETWLHGICRRVASDWRNKAHVRKEDLGVTTTERSSSGETPLRQIGLRQARTRLEAMLGELATQHERDFPQSAMGPEREIIAVRALVELGRLDEAKRRAGSFRTRWPTSNLLLRLNALAPE